MAMSSEFKDQLEKAGVSAEALGILDNEELSTEAALKRGYTYGEFRQMGIKAGSARILADMFPPPVPSQPQPRASQSNAAKLYIGKEPIDELVRNAAAGDPDAIADLQQRVGNKTLFVRDLATGKMDVDSSISCIQYVGIGEPVSKWNNIPTETLKDILIEKRWVNPLTGEVLVPGDDWLDIPPTRRVLVTFALITGVVKADNVDEDNLIQQLRKETLQGRWLRVSNAYEVAKSRRDVSVNDAENWLYEGGRPSQGQPFRLDQQSDAGQSVAFPGPSTPQVVMPKFGPGVHADFRKLTENYIRRDKQAMFKHLFERGLFLSLFDITEESALKGVPVEALYLLRAGSERGTFSEGAIRFLQNFYGMNPVIPFLGQPDNQFYQALESYCPDPDLVEWCGEIMYNPQFGVGVYTRPRPGSFHGFDSWQGHSVGRY